MKMLKKILFLLMLAAALAAGLAGCGEAGQTGEAGQDKTPDTLLFLYEGVGEQHGLAKNDGTIVVPPGDYDCTVYYDEEGRQRFAAKVESTYDPDNVNQYGQPLMTNRTYTFYDTQGEYIKGVGVDLSGANDYDVRFCLGADGSLENSRIFINELDNRGVYQLLDMEGQVVLSQQAAEPGEWKYSYAELLLAEGFMAVSCSFNGEDWLDSENRVDFYTLSGEAIDMGKDYTAIWGLYDALRERPAAYYIADYQGPQGQSLYDVLDREGQVVLSELQRVYSVNGNLFVVSRGFEHGIMNEKGEWVYKESNFNQLED